MDQAPASGEPAAPPADPGAGQALAAPATPNVSEDVTNTGTGPEQTVPFQRFQEVNDAKKAAEEEAARLKAELEAKAAPAPSQNDVDPEVLDVVKSAADKLGLVSKAELEAERAQLQVRQDIADLTSQYKETGVPFDGQAVIKFANENGMPIASKASLDAVYQYMNRDAILENARKAAIDGFQAGAASGGEKPGSSGAAPESKGDGGKVSLRDRIAAAKERAAA